MRITTIVAALPPRIDGIGDYTACLAAELAKSEDVQIVTAVGCDKAPANGIQVAPLFFPHEPKSIRRIIPCVKSNGPDWVVLQYNPFCFGRWGWNPYLAPTFKALRGSGRTRLALMVHEPYVPFDGWKNAIMTVWQRWQLWALGRAADVIFFSIEPWAIRYRRWFPNRPVCHLPVGSNMPHEILSREEARSRLGIAPGMLVAGLFGTAHNSRLIGTVKHAVSTARRAGLDVITLYIGADEAAIRATMGPMPILGGGIQPPNEVSRRLAAVDVYLSPFRDGVSTRRTSFITGLQHGLAVLGTDGYNTDARLKEMQGRAFQLTPSDSAEQFASRFCDILNSSKMREQLCGGALELFEQEFTWARIVSRLMTELRSIRPIGSP